MFTGKIKKNHEYASVFNSGNYLKLSSLVIQYKENSFDGDKTSTRYGIVVSKKIGNAVKRNLSKRRLRSLLDNINLTDEKKAVDYVFVAKKNLLKMKFSSLSLELNLALKKIKQAGK